MCADSVYGLFYQNLSTKLLSKSFLKIKRIKLFSYFIEEKKVNDKWELHCFRNIALGMTEIKILIARSFWMKNQWIIMNKGFKNFNRLICEQRAEYTKTLTASMSFNKR